MDRHEIKCIQKSYRQDPQNKIEFIGGLNSNGTQWRIKVERAIQGIESGKWQFYIRVGSDIVDVIISSYNNVKYLKSQNDDIEPNSLLKLPDCL